MMAVGIWSLHRTTAGVRAMMDVPLQKERLVDEWYAAILVGASRNSSIAMSDDETYSRKQTAQAREASAGVGKLYDSIMALASPAEEKALLQRITDRRKAYNSAKNDMMKARVTQ